MRTNIEISNITHHIPRPFFSSETNNCQNKKYKSKILTYDFYSMNEAHISDNIQRIPYYFNHFLIVEDYDFVKIHQMNDGFFEQLDEKSHDENKYLVFKYKNGKFISFHDFLFSFKNNPKMFIFHVIQSFSYVLKSLVLFNQHNMCVFHLSSQNIVFDLDCGEKPLIQDLQYSLLVSQLNEVYISNIIRNLDDYTSKPLEIHVLFYLIKNDMTTISHSFIEEICEVFTNNLTVLSLFSQSYRDNYKELCKRALVKYINKPKSYIVHDILQKHGTWDIYSVSVLYLHIFGNMAMVFSLKNNFISKITLALSKNIHPEPSERSELQNMLENIDKLFTLEKDWNFVNNLEKSKMKYLFDRLAE